MDLAQLRAFVAVIDEDGFTTAAHHLGVTQSTVSRAVAALERDLGVPLLVRGPRGAHTPTGVGVQVAEQARHILDRVDVIAAIARSERDDATGVLRIGTMPSIGPLLGPPVAAFSREHPGIRITIVEGRDTELTQWLTTGFVDVATVAANVSPAGDDADTRSGTGHLLAEDRWVVVLPVDHPLAELSVVRLADLEDDTLLMSDGGCEPLVRGVYDSAGLTCRPEFKIADIGTLFTLVREGMGVTVVPELSVAGVGGITSIPVDTHLRRRVRLAAAASMRRTTARFLDFVIQSSAGVSRR